MVVLFLKLVQFAVCKDTRVRPANMTAQTKHKEPASQGTWLSVCSDRRWRSKSLLWRAERLQVRGRGGQQGRSGRLRAIELSFVPEGGPTRLLKIKQTIMVLMRQQEPKANPLLEFLLQTIYCLPAGVKLTLQVAHLSPGGVNQLQPHIFTIFSHKVQCILLRFYMLKQHKL